MPTIKSKERPISWAYIKYGCWVLLTEHSLEPSQLFGLLSENIIINSVLLLFHNNDERLPFFLRYEGFIFRIFKSYTTLWQLSLYDFIYYIFHIIYELGSFYGKALFIYFQLYTIFFILIWIFPENVMLDSYCLLYKYSSIHLIFIW